MRKTSIFLVLVLLLSMFPVVVSAETDYTPQAETLKELGLFLGTNSGFELDRAATRTEAAVMTVRLLGKEAEAQKENFPHPFTDVPAWANFYIGYLYHYKITLGISDTQFGSSRTATSAQYATFVLRSLGYDDSAGDFAWDKSLDKMVSLGIITSAQAQTFASKPLRGHMAAISHLSLFANLKDDNTTLLEKLYLKDNAITLAQMKSASGKDSRVSMVSNVFGVPKSYPEGEVLDSEQIFEKSSGAVFTLNIKVIEDTDFGYGSGFFITSDGIAITNIHVVSHMSSAMVMTADGKEYPVEGVLAMNHKADLALIKVKGSGFPYLELGDPASLRTAQRVYCIGSPHGFDNTISDGLVSSASREVDGWQYIQISAPIAPGSSGGALLNEYGQVVGVTTLRTDDAVVGLAVKVTDLAGAFRFAQMRTVRYMQAHSHFNAIAMTDVTYSRIESEDDSSLQTMKNDTIMYGTITSADDVHSYLLDVEAQAEMIVSLTSNAASSAGLRFTVSDPSGKAILNSRHYDGEVFSLVTGPGAVKGLYKVTIFVEDSGEDWSKVDYELFWLYHESFEESGYSMRLFEFEPNDTPEHANYLPDFFNYLSSISAKDDVDYYTFTLSTKSKYTAVLMSNHDKAVLNAEIFDSDNKSVGRLSWESFAYYFNGTLPAGTYYIRVSVKDTSIEWDNDLYYISGWYDS